MRIATAHLSKSSFERGVWIPSVLVDLIQRRRLAFPVLEGHPQIPWSEANGLFGGCSRPFKRQANYQTGEDTCLLPEPRNKRQTWKRGQVRSPPFQSPHSGADPGGPDWTRDAQPGLVDLGLWSLAPSTHCTARNPVPLGSGGQLSFHRADTFCTPLGAQAPHSTRRLMPF